MKNKYLFLLLFVSFSFLNVYSQNLKKATYYFNNASYVEATDLFLNIEGKDKYILKCLGDCYYYSSDMENAKQWYEKLMDEYYDTISTEYLFRYSQALYGTDNISEGNKWLKKYQNAANIKELDSATIAKNYSRLQIPNKELQIYRLQTNTDKSEFGGSFLNNDTFIFSASSDQGIKYSWNKENYLDLYEATINENGYFEDIKPLSKAVNSKWHEANAIYTKDGNTIYFTSNKRDGNKKILGKNKISYLNIYKATKVNGTWGNIISLPFNVENFITEHPSLNEDETKLYFASDRPGTLGSLDLYVVDIFEDGTFGKPINLGTKINTEKREQFPFVNNDSLYFASDGHLGLGGLDVYKSYAKNNIYTKPENLNTGINSTLDDFAYTINDSLGKGYFSSNRDGSDDIFLFERLKTECETQVEVRDKITNELIDGAILKLFIDGQEVVEKRTLKLVTILETDCNPEKEYNVNVQHELYQPKSIVLTQAQISDNKKVIVFLDSYVVIEELIVEKNNKVQIDHDPILFDLDSSYLTKEAVIILDDIIEVLNNYPEIVIRCESHTDSRATNSYNKWLSDKRADRTEEYIISKGIDASRLTKIGFGETQLLNKCSNGVKCKEEEHQINRRSEFVLISKPE